LLRMGTRVVLLDTCCDISASCSVNDRCTDGDDSCCCPLLIVIAGKTKSEIVSIIIVKVDNSFIFLDNVLSTPKKHYSISLLLKAIVRDRSKLLHRLVIHISRFR
jgi:hypothetical protein